MSLRVLLETYPLQAVSVGELEVETHGRVQHRLPLRQYVLAGRVCLGGAAGAATDVSVKATALLDTGTDITTVSHRLVETLEDALGGLIPVERRVCSRGSMRPALDLAFVLPNDDATACESAYGFIHGDDLDLGDLWIGQDLLNQWIVTFDGPAGTLTIAHATPGEAP